MKLESKENAFPEDLEGRLNAVMNIVNSELKSLTLLHLSTEHSLTGGEIHGKVARTLKGKGYLPNQLAFEEYCSCTLYPIGAVAMETVLSESDVRIRTAYRLTSAGSLYGLPITAFSLHWAEEHGSLYSVLGATVSARKTRSPTNKIRILEALAEQERLRAVDIAHELKMNDSTISHNLSALKKSGMIEYYSVSGREGSYVTYEFINSGLPVETIGRKPNMTGEVYGLVKKLKLSDSREISSILKVNHPSNVSVILSGLERQGHLKRVSAWRQGKLSEAQITEKGLEFVRGYISPLKAALADELHLEEMNNKYLVPLLTNEDFFSLMAQKSSTAYSRVSPGINSLSKDERIRQVLSMIKEDRFLFPGDIANTLGVHKETVFAYLRILEKEGLVIGNYEKGRKLFRKK